MAYFAATHAQERQVLTQLPVRTSGDSVGAPAQLSTLHVLEAALKLHEDWWSLLAFFPRVLQ